MAISVSTESEMEDNWIDPFTIHLQLVSATNETTTRALINTRIDCNIPSYETWVPMGKPQLCDSKLTFTSFFGTCTSSLEKLCVKARIQEQSIHILFHVANKNQAFVNVVLG